MKFARDATSIVADSITRWWAKQRPDRSHGNEGGGPTIGPLFVPLSAEGVIEALRALGALGAIEALGAHGARGALGGLGEAKATGAIIAAGSSDVFWRLASLSKTGLKHRDRFVLGPTWGLRHEKKLENTDVQMHICQDDECVQVRTDIFRGSHVHDNI